MIPTKYANLTNQEVMDKMAQLTAKSENGRCYFTDPTEAADILQEAMNRIQGLDEILNRPWNPVEELLPPLEDDWDSIIVSKQVIVLFVNGEVSKDVYWKEKGTDDSGWSYNESSMITHWMPFIEPQKGGKQ